MKKIHIIFNDGKEQVVICEDYEVKDCILWLIRVESVDEIEVRDSKKGKMLIIHNMSCVRSLIIEWN